MANSYNPQVINAATVAGASKPTSLNQIRKYTKSEVKRYNRQRAAERRADRKEMRSRGRQFRKNLRAAASENFREKQLMHGTIRQGLAEGATIITQALAPAASKGIMNAVNQNTSGGVKATESNSASKDSKDTLDKGPVNANRYSYSERDED